MKNRHFVTDSKGQSTQVAALCWRKHRDRVEVLLITSRDTGRWVLPKGWPIPGLNAHEAAAIEAWEEAGVRGPVTPDALGYFGYDKVMAADVAKMTSAKTVQGGSAKVSTMGGTVMIDQSHVTKADIAASNGVIHVVDTVLMPK